MTEQELLRQMAAIVRAAGAPLPGKEADGIREKSGHRDLVTRYDIQTQQFLQEKLTALLPEAVFIGEETGGGQVPETGDCLIVDPIDGTMNFIRDLHHSCVSVGLLRDGRPEMGVVYDPYGRELFTARRGGGAFLNDRPIQVAAHRLRDSLVAIGTAPYHAELTEKTMALTRLALEESLDIRRCGSAALDLCYVACGRYDLYFECEICPWDWAAGRLIVTEAGGVFGDLFGQPVSENASSAVLAGGKQAVREFLSRCRERGL